MKTLLLSIGAMLSFIASSCPMCNIHNYMATSVEGTNGIRTGLVINNRHGTIAFKVLTIYEGGGCIGDTLYASHSHFQKGDTIVNINRKHMAGSWYNTFEYAQLHEVLFLARGYRPLKDTLGFGSYFPEVDSYDLAEKLLLGASNEAVYSQMGCSVINNFYRLDFIGPGNCNCVPI